MDDLINETKKGSQRPKGFRVGSTKAAANKSGKGGSNRGEVSAKRGKRAPIDLGVKGKKISKPKDANEKGSRRGPGVWSSVLVSHKMPSRSPHVCIILGRQSVSPS